MLSLDEHFRTHKVASQQLTHLFRIVSCSIDFQSKPNVILMDCTYKTNVFEMPLLDMVGVTGMNTTHRPYYL